MTKRSEWALMVVLPTVDAPLVILHRSIIIVMMMSSFNVIGEFLLSYSPSNSV